MKYTIKTNDPSGAAPMMLAEFEAESEESAESFFRELFIEGGYGPPRSDLMLSPIDPGRQDPIPIRLAA